MTPEHAPAPVPFSFKFGDFEMDGQFDWKWVPDVDAFGECEISVELVEEPA